MTKWICKACTMGDCSAENLGWTPECLYGHRDLTPKWERVDEPEAQATKWVGGRCACTYYPLEWSYLTP